MSFSKAKIYKEKDNDNWLVEIEYKGYIWGVYTRTHEFETYELALTFLARERCKGNIDLPKYETNETN